MLYDELLKTTPSFKEPVLPSLWWLDGHNENKMPTSYDTCVCVACGHITCSREQELLRFCNLLQKLSNSSSNRFGLLSNKPPFSLRAWRPSSKVDWRGVFRWRERRSTASLSLARHLLEQPITLLYASKKPNKVKNSEYLEMKHVYYFVHVRWTVQSVARKRK